MTNNWRDLLEKYGHDPIDKCFDIGGHVKRAEQYWEWLTGLKPSKEVYQAADEVASQMERALLPEEQAERLWQEFTGVRHPLSGVWLEYTGPKGEEAINYFEEAYRQVAKEEGPGNDYKKLFLCIWRNLPQKLFKHLASPGLKRWIELFPADTRMPDHSIWEHLKVVSAINAEREGQQIYQCNALFLFTVGPVQGFIKQARKTHDYYMGSFLLSYLTFIAMIPILENFGPTSIVFPDMYGQPLMDWWLERNVQVTVPEGWKKLIHLPTLPNRFVAILPLCDKETIEGIGKQIESRIHRELLVIMESMWNYLGNRDLSLRDEFKRLWRQQWMRHFQCYWAGVLWRIGERDIDVDDFAGYMPEKEIRRFKQILQLIDEKGMYQANVGVLYPLLYKALEKGLAARKNTRKVYPLTERGRKCSVCGERNVIVGRGVQGVINLDNRSKFPYRYVADGEGLCAVCLTKRMFEQYLDKQFGFKGGDERFSFPSTGEVAIADWKERLYGLLENNEALREAYEDIHCALRLADANRRVLFTIPLPRIKIGDKFSDWKEKNIDGWAILEGLLEDYKQFRKEVGESLEEDSFNEQVRESWNKVKKAIGTEPFPYYALIAMDGDEMGKWLGGEKLPELKETYHPETWRLLNEQQDYKRFISEVQSILANRKVLTPAIHAAISVALKNFSLEFVPHIVEKQYLGKLIYAGGDDVLAMANLKDLLAIMRTLRAAFSGQITWHGERIDVNWANTSGFVEKDGRLRLMMGINATASMGIVIAHYKTPLQIVIETAYKMEKRAKNLGRDRWALAVIRHSGNVTEVVMPWRVCGQIDVVATVEEVINNILPDEKMFSPFSDKFIDALLTEFHAWTEIDPESVGEFEQLVLDDKGELKRLLARSCEISDNVQKEEAIQRMWQLLRDLWEASKLGVPERPIYNFFSMLLVIRFLGRRAQVQVNNQIARV